MKELDLNKIATEAQRQIEEADYTLAEWAGVQIATMIVSNVYVTSNFTSGFGQDFNELGFSIISSPNRISLICDRDMTWIKVDPKICLYEDLAGDIECILQAIQACFDDLW